MKTALVVLVLTAAVPHRIALVVLGQPVPVSWLLVAAEVLAAAAGVWLAVHAVRRFRSVPWLRSAWLPGGAW